jgi:transposase
VDKGYAGVTVVGSAARTGVSVAVVSRSKSEHGFIVRSQCWVVERTNAWINHCRRLDATAR